MKDKLYAKAKEDISDIEMGLIMEKVDRIIYGSKASEVIRRSKVVR